MVNFDGLARSGRKCGLSDGQLETLAPLAGQVLGEPFFSSHVEMLRSGKPTEAEAASHFSEVPRQRQYNLLLILALYPSAEEYYREQGWDRAMLQEISGDLAIWVRHHEDNFGYPGLQWRIVGWQRDILTGRIIQCGRLQCNIESSFIGSFSVFRNKTSGELLNAPESPGADWECMLAPGDPVINLHIPASGPLIIADCVDSLERMAKFFAAFKPDYQYRAFVCYSWFLDSRLQRILKPDSNIVKFQQLGHLFDSGEPGDAVWRVFGEKGVTEGIRNITPRNDMQRRIADFINSGGTLYYGNWYLLEDELAGLKSG